MRGSLFWKLMAAFAVVILVGIGGATTEAEFRRYTRGSDDTGRWEETAADLAGYYAAHTGWDGVEALLQRGYGRGRAGGGGPPLRLADTDGRIVADQSGARPAHPRGRQAGRHAVDARRRMADRGTRGVPRSNEGHADNLRRRGAGGRAGAGRAARAAHHPPAAATRRRPRTTRWGNWRPPSIR
jgi:hypothetical protein